MQLDTCAGRRRVRNVRTVVLSLPNRKRSSSLQPRSRIKFHFNSPLPSPSPFPSRVIRDYASRRGLELTEGNRCQRNNFTKKSQEAQIYRRIEYIYIYIANKFAKIQRARRFAMRLRRALLLQSRCELFGINASTHVTFPIYSVLSKTRFLVCRNSTAVVSFPKVRRTRLAFRASKDRKGTTA